MNRRRTIMTCSGGGSAAAFSGDFGALFTGYGLTVRAYRRGDLGTSGSVGSGIAAWAHQAGDATAMSPGTGATNGIGTITAGLNGRAGIAANGATQNGTYTIAAAQPVPGTTNVNIWAIGRIISAATGFVYSAGLFGINTPLNDANIGAYNNGQGKFTAGAVLNQWYRLRTSFLGNAENTQIGNKAAASGTFGGNIAASSTWCFASYTAGAQRVPYEELCYVHVEGPEATFLTAAADADARAQTFWTNAIEI